MIDFGKLDELDAVTPANQGAWLTLLDKDQRPTKKRLKLLGVNSDTWRSDTYSDTDQRQRVLAKTGKPQIETAAQTDERLRKRVAKMCVAWEGFPGTDGNPAPCTRENVLAVLNHPTIGPSVFEQALNFILEPANYGETGERAPDPRDPDAKAAEIEGNLQSGPIGNSAQA